MTNVNWFTWYVRIHFVEIVGLLLSSDKMLNTTSAKPSDVLTNRQQKLYWMLNIDFELHNVVYFHETTKIAYALSHSMHAQYTQTTHSLSIRKSLCVFWTVVNCVLGNEGKKKIVTREQEFEKRNAEDKHISEQLSDGNDYSHVFWMKRVCFVWMHHCRLALQLPIVR